MTEDRERGIERTEAERTAEVSVLNLRLSTFSYCWRSAGGLPMTIQPREPASTMVISKNFLIAKARALRRPVFLYPMKIPRLFAALPLLLAGLGAMASAADNITTPEQLFPQLDGILKRAVARSPRMIGRAIDLEIAENNRISARAGMLPSIGGSYSYYKGQDDRADLNGRIPVTKVYYSFSINQPLFYWGDRRNGARIGEIQQAITQGQVREAYRLLAQELRGIYLRLILNKLYQKKAQFSAEAARKLQRQAEERLLKKVISDAQIFGIRLDAERAQIYWDRVNFEAESMKASFARLTGDPVLNDNDIPDAIPEVADQNPSVQRLLAGFLAQKDPATPEAEEMRKKQEIERLGLLAQKNRLKPKFNLLVAASQDQQSYTLNVAQKYQVNSYYGGVSIYWTIFDGLASGAAVRNSLARIRQLELDYRALTENLGQQAQNQSRVIGFAFRNASITDRLLVSGEGNLNYRNEQFTRGVIAEEDVNAARLNFYDAQINACTSRADCLNQVSSFLGIVREDPVLANLAIK